MSSSNHIIVCMGGQTLDMGVLTGAGQFGRTPRRTWQLSREPSEIAPVSSAALVEQADLASQVSYYESYCEANQVKLFVEQADLASQASYYESYSAYCEADHR
jgi:hypothetical protein